MNAPDRYVCENCGRLGPITSFNDDCRPGWTHGRLIRVTEVVEQPHDERDAEINRLVDALEFYADPESYFAIGFFPDPPCGSFMDDFDKTHIGMKPGKLARKVLAELQWQRETCEHEWVDARNEVVESGMVCLKCGALRGDDNDLH